jgi:transposase
MNYKHFIGIDVSKSWLDFTVMNGNQVLSHEQIENTENSIDEYFKKLCKSNNLSLKESLICMEHTGIYNNHLLSYLSKKKANLCLESGLRIRQSSGFKRGKNDKVDSIRIAQYAYKNSSEVRLWQPKREVIYGLKQLTTLRNRIVNVIKQIKTPLKESGEYLSKAEQKRIFSLNKNSLTALENDLRKINKEITTLISFDPELNRLFNLITSVTGVGSVTATEVIITTNEFKTIDCPKKYACYSGVAPFEHQSGSSIRGKTRVSSMGNKSIKKLLHMAALSACKCPGDLKEYFDRKVLEGKNKMLIINAIRNKIIARIFACVKQNRFYEKNHKNLLFYP